MDKWITNLLLNPITFGKKKIKIALIDMMLAVFTIVFGIMIRQAVISFQSIAADEYLEVANAFKYGSMVFELLIGVVAGLVVYRTTKLLRRSLLAFTTAFLLPTIIACGAMFGLLDSLHLLLLLLSLYFVYIGKANIGAIVCAVAIWVHPNGWFLVPLFVLLFLLEKCQFISLISMILLGILKELLLNRGYLDQIPIYSVQNMYQLSRNSENLSDYAPNMYQLIGVNEFVNQYTKVGFALVIVAVCIFVVYGVIQKIGIKKEELLGVTLFFSIFIPFFLPGMDARSFLFSNLVALVIALIQPKKSYYLIGITILIYSSYSGVLRGETAIPMVLMAIGMFVMLILSMQDVYRMKAKEEDRV